VITELGDADAVLLTPAHQFPLGLALAAQRRTRAVEWALDAAGFVIEDDYDGEFRYDRPTLGAMQALAPEHVVYAGTASKSLAPGLRLGWLALPTGLLDEVVAAKTPADRHTSTLDQLSLAEFLAVGGYDRHVRRSRIAYRQRRDLLVSTLRREAPNVRINGIAAGLHALLELPAGQREDEIVKRAAQHDLAIEGLHPYAAEDHQHSPALVVGYGKPPQPTFIEAVARLCRVLNGHTATEA
jgi:GntR family transcriptional regulator/MocR family aminotransferase